MAKLYFSYSAMNAGKSTLLLQAAYNYQERGMDALLLVSVVDNRTSIGEIASRIGISREAETFSAADDLFELVRDCGATLGLTIGWNATGGVCDGNNIAACGVPVVDTMGPRGGAIHSSDEFLIVDSLAERARLSALTLLKIAERGTV